MTPLRMRDVTVVVELVVGWRLEGADSGPSEPRTLVWVRDLPHPFSIRGDHCDTLAEAVRGIRPRVAPTSSAFEVAYR